MSQSQLSIIIPAYNEAPNIKSTVQSIFSCPQFADWEVLVVNDGSTDGTANLLQQIKNHHPALQIINLSTNQGKGEAVKQGMLKSAGEWSLFMDADSSTRIDEIQKLWPHRHEYDVIIGSRHLQTDSIKTPQPRLRHLAGRVGNLITRNLLLPEIADTQCGFKLFNRRAAQDLFSLQTMTGWSFDLEILALARARDYQIKEVPVDWSHRASDRISILTDGLKILSDTIAIRRRIKNM